MAQTVLDSTNTEAIIADALGNPQEKDPEKVEAKGEKTEKTEETDDIEGEDGLTPRQKRELTQKMQSAIGKKHRALKDAEEFATEQYNERRLAEQRAEQAQRELERLKNQFQPPKKEAEEPKREDFKTDQEYQDARIDWKADLKFREKESERLKALEAERQQQILQQAKERISKAIELVPDFTEVTEAADGRVPDHIAGYMQESEMFAELGYHLAKHPEELQRISSLRPDKALVEIGKIESRLTPFAELHSGSPKDAGEKPEVELKSNGAQPSPETVEKPSKPRAAAPIKPLSSSSAVQVEKPEAEMDAKEALAAWQKRKHVNLTRRQRH